MSKASAQAQCLAQPGACPLTVNSGKSSGASRRAWCRGKGCSAGGSQYRSLLVSVFTTQGPSPIMATTSSLDIARSRFSPWNMGSLVTQNSSLRGGAGGHSDPISLIMGGMVLRLTCRSGAYGA